jgi:hypothetical protein
LDLVLRSQGRPEEGFEWTYHFFRGLDQLGDVFTDMWLSLLLGP